MKYDNVSCFTSRRGDICDANSVDGSGLTLSNMIRLESSGSCEEARPNIFGNLMGENGTEYLPQGALHYVNRKSGA
ncbi:UNVERIFIED_CONTAM: hypothetical protein Slati_2478700 [Sesamum latifolium]|uniref:Uncharacterized protein n=1 Tax=Sesamum latifolium TaxID=2727402 RepID=A0AAW2WE54_9LAMI